MFPTSTGLLYRLSFMADLTIEIVEGPGAGKQVTLTEPLDIGRDPHSGLILDDDQVSRHHARITPDESGAVVEDLGSSNGTFVNHNELVAPARVTDGDELLIGVSVLQLRSAVQVAAQLSAVRAVPAALAVPERRPTFVDPPAGAAPASVAPDLQRLVDARTKAKAQLAPLAVFVLAALVVLIYFGTQ